MDRSDALQWLREDDASRLETLWRRADDVRRSQSGDVVRLCGLVELSNRCARRCAYCGNRSERTIHRYRMRDHEVLDCAHLCAERGYEGVLLQAGEDPEITSEWLADIIRSIKEETPLTVTLGLGERTAPELAAWREAGADRYLLRFETSNRALYERLHPPAPGRRPVDRIELLGVMRRLGYTVGSGVLVGIPGQSWSDLADDLDLFRSLDLDMIAVGPWIPHPDTPLVQDTPAFAVPDDDQVPADDEVVFRLLALARLACPSTAIPCASAHAEIDRVEGRVLALRRGADVVQTNVTPTRYRRCYEVHPTRPTNGPNDAEALDREVRATLRALGRSVRSPLPMVQV